LLWLALLLGPAAAAAADPPSLLVQNASGLTIEAIYLAPTGRRLDEWSDRLAMPPLGHGESFRVAALPGPGCRWHVSVRFPRDWRRDWPARDLCRNPVLTVPPCDQGCIRPPE
jgi:hypothetical protein